MQSILCVSFSSLDPGKERWWWRKCSPEEPWVDLTLRNSLLSMKVDAWRCLSCIFSFPLTSFSSSCHRLQSLIRFLPVILLFSVLLSCLCLSIAWHPSSSSCTRPSQTHFFTPFLLSLLCYGMSLNSCRCIEGQMNTKKHRTKRGKSERTIRRKGCKHENQGDNKSNGNV